MFKLLIAATIAVLVAIKAPTAEAQFYDGNKLHRICSDDYAACLHYVLGIIDQVRTTVANLQSFADAIPDKGAKEAFGIATGIINFCPPASATAGQLTDVVTRYLRNKP
jgi:hypothetical protein